jgi:hypothetical protein
MLQQSQSGHISLQAGDFLGGGVYAAVINEHDLVIDRAIQSPTNL